MRIVIDTNILISAIKNADKKIPSKVAKLVKATKDFPGIANNITFDEKGDVVHQPFSVYRVSGGRFVAIKN